MDLLKCAKLINLKIEELETHKKDLENFALEKAMATSEYESILSKEMLKLRTGGESITLIEKLAKGSCVLERMKMDLAESKYKNLLKIIEITQAQMNALQSINRYLSEV